MSSPWSLRTNKKPPPPGEGPFGLRWAGALALSPPRSSVLLPGAGNQAKKAEKTKPKGPKKAEDRYIDETAVMDGQLHAAAVRGHRDGDSAAIPTVQQAQCGLPMAANRLAGLAV